MVMVLLQKQQSGGQEGTVPVGTRNISRFRGGGNGATGYTATYGIRNISGMRRTGGAGNAGAANSSLPSTVINVS